MEYETIIYTKEDRIARITLNRPEALNPLNAKTTLEVQDALKRAEEDAEVKVAIVTGTGRAFSAGGDIREMVRLTETPPAQLESLLHKLHLTVVQMSKMEKPIIAQINGLVYGAALDFTLACDMRIASSGARLCEAYLGVGLSPGMGTLFMLPRYVGLGRAMHMIYTQKVIDAAEAERLGLVDVVVPPEKLEETVREYANRFATGASKAIAIVKRALWRGLSSNLETEQLWTANEQVLEFKTKDVKEAMTAFLEKRKPTFTGE